ncbi:MSL complex subunit 3-like [Clavelina lepadiformis]|uniref:MSL complex subunit 3-like n=1 Tax=Clavelina lepadiformis TaxID=159417 RepID=UPI004041748A
MDTKIKPKFSVGERVLCFEPDQSKARVLYDAKILDADFVKDSSGKLKKETEYKIHFQGWNSAWDRWANESFVLKNTPENKKLQRKLAKKAIKKLKSHGRRKVHLPGVASVLKNVSIEDVSSDSESSVASEQPANDIFLEEQNDSDLNLGSPVMKRRRKKSTASSNKSIDDIPSGSIGVFTSEMPLEPPPSITVAPGVPISKKIWTLDLPAVLKRRLEDDNTMITKRNMIVELPAKLNIVQILENYIRHFAMNIALLPSSEKNLKPVTVSQNGDKLPPEKNLNLCKETCEDLRILFDFTLPIILLYYCERDQCKKLASSCKLQYNTPSDAKVATSPVASVNSNASPPHQQKEHDGTSPRAELIEHQSLSPYKAIKDQISGEGTNTLAKNLQTTESNKKKAGKPLSKPLSHHRKTAEEQIIEETHTYLIPHQPNLDRTGLSNDAQGRRRSSRLSHHLHSPDKSGDEMAISPPISPELPEIEPLLNPGKNLSPESNTSHPIVPIPMEPIIFLRASPHHIHGSKEKGLHSPIPLLCKDTDTYSCNSPTITLNQMCQESYVGSAGEDVKRAVHLAQAWKYRLFPSHYQPSSGANVPCSLIYGYHHFLRLFVKIPQIFSNMQFPDYKLKVICRHLQILLKFLADYDREIHLASSGYVDAK